MIARLILALLLAAFAVPTAAPAACHDASTSPAHAVSAMTAMKMTAAVSATVSAAGDSTPDRKAVPPHGCIGCIPPSHWAGARLAPVAPADLPTLVERAAVLDVGLTAAPVPPPPRDA